MAKFDIVMPKLGESIIEATITRWLKKEGDMISEDDAIVEIATDKVDSEIPSPVEGKLIKLLFNEGDVVAVGAVIAVIDMGGDSTETVTAEAVSEPVVSTASTSSAPVEPGVSTGSTTGGITETTQVEASRFYSPLIRSIAKQENIAMAVLETIPGSGKDGRLTKEDLLAYLAAPRVSTSSTGSVSTASPTPPIPPSPSPSITPSPTPALGDRIIEMDRMRKLIADHMVASVQTSPHVTSVVEVDMTRIVKWRDKVKDALLKRENEKLTFTHIFVEAIARTIKEFPMVNASVDGNKIILKKNVNVGMAVALPSGNLIVPVIRNADQKNLLGIVKDVNDVADRARNNKLQPDDIQGGTITLTNLGSFGTVFGTPIINQPQLAIVAVGTITKRPVVVETPEGDTIAIRHMMFLSLSYDHRVIDGALGGKFIYRMKELLENFDNNLSI
jgi:2-oxoglutarate dehydrogenase E2 component (dihydrolipoamide succinyltransferase)